MLYSILPPILVVLSLVGIIIILVKKAPQVSKLDYDDEFRDSSAIDLREPGTIRKSAERMKKVNWKFGEKFTLAVLEKIMKILRAFFLKLGILFSRGWIGIKNARKRKVEEEENNKAEAHEKSIITRLRNHSYPKRSADEQEIGSAEKIVVKKEVHSMDAEEKPVKPMVSEKVTKPKYRTEMKDRLEELLIERIAANPKDVEAYERLGEYYMEIENFEFSKECFKQVIKLSPTNRNAKYKIKKLERLLGK